MSAIANIIAYDGAATPAIHSFVPVSVTREKDSVVAEYREQIASLPAEAQGRVTVIKTSLKNGIIRTSTRVEIPVMEAIGAQNAAGYTAAPKVAFIDTCDIVSYASPRSTITGRRTVRQLAVNIGNNVSTSVAAATTGPVPEVVDLLVAPT